MANISSSPDRELLLAEHDELDDYVQPGSIDSLEIDDGLPDDCKGIKAASQIGMIEGIMTLVQAFSQPLWGIISDKSRNRKTVTLTTSILNTCLLLLLALPSVSSSGFWGIFAVSVAMSSFISGSWLDAYTLDLLGEKDRDQFGQYNLWGSLSWGLGALFMGFMTDAFGFTANFSFYGVLSFASVGLVWWRIPAQTNLEKSVDAESVRVSSLITSLMHPRVVFFFMDIIAFGAGMAIVERLLFLYLLNDLHASTTLCGLTVGVTVLFELPIFHYSAVLLRHFSHDAMFMVAMVSYVIRVYGYTLLTPETVWFILLLELLHGITFALMWTAGVKFMSITAPEEWLTTAQSIFSAVYFCIGYGSGSIVGGWVMEHYGARFLYRAAAASISVLFCIHGIVMGVSKLRHHRLSRSII